MKIQQNHQYGFHVLLSLTVLFLTIIFLSACATLSREECQNGDWYAIGYKDGVAGRYPNYIVNHQKACSKFAIPPNHQAWETGRQEGLKHYCTKITAYQLGEKGRPLHAVCPGDMAETLQRIHARGMAQYERQQQIENDEKKIKDYTTELEILRNGGKMHFDTEKEAREYMLKLQSKIFRLERRISENRYDFERARQKDKKMLR